MAVVVLDTDAASRLQKGQLSWAVAQSLVGATIVLTFQLVTYNRADFEDFRQYHELRMLPGGNEW